MRFKIRFYIGHDPLFNQQIHLNEGITKKDLIRYHFFKKKSPDCLEVIKDVVYLHTQNEGV